MALFKKLDLLSTKTLIIMYYAFIHCLLQYRILNRGNLNSSILNPLKIIHNHTIRLMSFTKLKNKVNLNKLYLSFNIFKVDKFMYLQSNNLLPEVFADFFYVSVKVT